jgi:cyclopropane fatty-acyl-phospholipid synthase-like methyltransferase
LVAAMTFGLLVALGLRQHHTLLDVGCGSLRVGRLLIPYLNVGNYFGIEPNRWLVDEGIAREVGGDLIRIKRPTFSFSDSMHDFPAAAPFDFIVAQSIFSHTGPDLLRSWLEQLAPRLRSSGALAATFLPDARDQQQPGWFYPECVHYRPQTLEAMARACGLQFALLDWRHPRQQWALLAGAHYDVASLLARPLGWNAALRFHKPD